MPSHADAQDDVFKIWLMFSAADVESTQSRLGRGDDVSDQLVAVRKHLDSVQV